MNCHSLEVKQEHHLDALESPSTILMSGSSIHELLSPVAYVSQIQAMMQKSVQICSNPSKLI